MAARPGRGLNQRDGDFPSLAMRNHGADTELGQRPRRITVATDTPWADTTIWTGPTANC